MYQNTFIEIITQDCEAYIHDSMTGIPSFLRNVFDFSTDGKFHFERKKDVYGTGTVRYRTL